MTRPLLITAAIAACVAAVSPAAAAAQAVPSVTLSPAIAEGTARAGVRVGPFGIRNGTAQAYDLRMFPVLLGQARDGGLFVRLDPASRARARELMSSTRSRAGFTPGARLAAAARIRRVPAREGLYGGLLFEASPRPAADGQVPQISNLLRLNARVLLDPPEHLRRISLATGRIRAEQAGPRRIALRVPVANRGNLFVPVRGRVTVRDAADRIVASERLVPIRVLPGATVDLARRLPGTLPAGDYRISAELRAGRRRASAEGAMRLVAPGQVPTRTARLVAFSPPRTYRGQRAEVRASFRNSGNVAFAPAAELVVRRAGGAGTGPVLARVPATAERVAPGRTGTLRAAFDVPARSGPLELTVRLTAGARTLDQRTAGATPVRRPALLSRVSDTVTEHAISVLVLAVVPLLAALMLAVRHVRRLQARLREAQGESP